MTALLITSKLTPHPPSICVCKERKREHQWFGRCQAMQCCNTEASTASLISEPFGCVCVATGMTCASWPLFITTQFCLCLFSVTDANHFCSLTTPLSPLNDVYLRCAALVFAFRLRVLGLRCWSYQVIQHGHTVFNGALLLQVGLQILQESKDFLSFTKTIETGKKHA